MQLATYKLYPSTILEKTHTYLKAHFNKNLSVFYKLDYAVVFLTISWTFFARINTEFWERFGIFSFLKQNGKADLRRFSSFGPCVHFMWFTHVMKQYIGEEILLNSVVFGFLQVTLIGGDISFLPYPKFIFGIYVIV